MKVFSRENGVTRLIGRCDVEDDGSLVYDVYLLGSTSTLIERFGIGECGLRDELGVFAFVRGILLVPGQNPELLPGWQPLSS